MAGYECEFTDPARHSAVWLHTNMETGATVALCAEHNGPGLIPLVAAELGVDPMGLYQSVEAYLKRQDKQAARDLAAAQAAEQGAPDDLVPDSQDGHALVPDHERMDLERAEQLAAADPEDRQ